MEVNLMTILIYVLIAIILILVAATAVNKTLGGLAVAVFVAGFGVYFLVDPVIGTLAIKSSLLTITVLIAIRLFKFITK